jgi:hypothetical protein
VVPGPETEPYYACRSLFRHSVTHSWCRRCLEATCFGGDGLAELPAPEEVQDELRAYHSNKSLSETMCRMVSDRHFIILKPVSAHSSKMKATLHKFELAFILLEFELLVYACSRWRLEFYQEFIFPLKIRSTTSFGGEVNVDLRHVKEPHEHEKMLCRQNSAAMSLLLCY